MWKFLTERMARINTHFRIDTISGIILQIGAISIWRNARSLKNGVKTHWNPLKWVFFGGR